MAEALAKGIMVADDVVDPNAKRQVDKDSSEPPNKRGRGRASKQAGTDDGELDAQTLRKILKQKDDEIQVKNAQLDTMQIELDGARDENKVLKDDNDKKEDELKNLNARLQQKERDYTDLLEQIDALEKASPRASKPADKIKALLVVDEITKAISEFLTDDFDWLFITLDDAISESPKLRANVDVAFICTGTNKLLAGEDWYVIYERILLLTSKLQEHDIPFHVISLPPVDKKNLTGKVSLLNYKLAKQLADKDAYLEIDTSALNRLEFLEGNGYKLNVRGLEWYGIQINKSIPLLRVVKLDRAASATTTHGTTGACNIPSLKVLVDIKKEDIGKVIGKGGHMIKQIAEDNKVLLNVGKWYEKDRADNKYKEVADKVMIAGDLQNILTAKATIESMI